MNKYYATSNKLFNQSKLSMFYILILVMAPCLSAQDGYINEYGYRSAIEKSVTIWGEIDNFLGITKIDGSAKEGTWKVGIQRYCTTESAYVDNSGLIYKVFCVCENFGSKSKVSFISQSVAPFMDEFEPIVKDFVKGMEDFKDMPIYVSRYEGSFALSAVIDHGYDGGIDLTDLKKRLFNFINTAQELICKIYEKREEAVEELKKKTIPFVDKASMGIILDIEEFEKKGNGTEGSWNWVIEECSYWLDNYGDRMVLWLKIQNTKDESRQKVIDEMNKYLKSNPLEKVLKAEIIISGTDPWLMAEYSLKGLSNKEIIKLYESFEEYSEDFNYKAVDIVDDLN